MNLWQSEIYQTPETLLEQRRREKEVSDLLANLPTQQQVLIRMLYFEGIKRQECARLLRWSPRKVSRQRHLAFQQLRTALDV